MLDSEVEEGSAPTTATDEYLRKKANAFRQYVCRYLHFLQEKALIWGCTTTPILEVDA